MLPSEATHSSLDLFEKPSMLVTFDNAFEQRIGPVYSSDGPTLEFKLVGDRNNFIDLQKIYLELNCTIRQADGSALRAHVTDNAQRDTPNFVNNILHSLFSECDIFANGIKVSSANGLYAHKSFIETEMSFGKEAKDTWLKCQGYSYESDPSDRTIQTVVDRRDLTARSATVKLIGRLSVDFFSCDKLLLPNVSLRIKLVRSHGDFVTVSEDAGKHYTIRLSNANLYARKMTVSDHVVESIERVLTKTPALYKYTEVIPKTFVIPPGQFTWRHEDVFMKEPIRRLAIAMNTNTAFAGSNVTNPFHYQKFDLRNITLLRNGIPIAGTPLETADNKRAYFASLGSLSFTSHGHGIPLEEFDNHFVIVFDLTSTQEASQEYIHPELTNTSLSLDLTFGRQIAAAIEVFLLGEKTSTIYINKSRNISKNALMG